MNTTSARTQLIIRALQVVISSWKELKFTFLKDGVFQNLAVHLLLAQRWFHVVWLLFNQNSSDQNTMNSQLWIVTLGRSPEWEITIAQRLYGY